MHTAHPLQNTQEYGILQFTLQSFQYVRQPQLLKKHVSFAVQILEAFEKWRNATISFVMSCPSVRPSAWNNSAPNGMIFMKFDI
jgi:hypothetical protein